MKASENSTLQPDGSLQPALFVDFKMRMDMHMDVAIRSKSGGRFPLPFSGTKPTFSLDAHFMTVRDAIVTFNTSTSRAKQPACGRSSNKTTPIVSIVPASMFWRIVFLPASFSTNFGIPENPPKTTSRFCGEVYGSVGRVRSNVARVNVCRHVNEAASFLGFWNAFRANHEVFQLAENYDVNAVSRDL